MTDTILKALATITDIGEAESDSPTGGFTAVLSTPGLDRDGDQLLQKEWVLPLPDHITLDVDHEMSVRGTIGSAKPYFDDGGRLMIDATFASTVTAQETRSLVREGHIRTVSVAFMTDKSKKDGTPRRELLNAGLVAIPSNREAVILSSKAIGAISAYRKAASAPGQAELLQAIHDAAAILGAACVGVDTAETDTDSGEDDGANKSLDPAANVAAGIAHITDKMSAFEAALDAVLTKTSSDPAGAPQGDSSPAEPPAEAASKAAPTGPADEPAEAAGKAADVSDEDVATKARLMQAGLFMSETALAALDS